MALKSNGTVAAWGGSTFGQSTVPADLNRVVDIASGHFHCLALKDDGTVVAWGNDNSGQSTVPASLVGVAAIAAGQLHSLALLNDSAPIVFRQPRNQTVVVGTAMMWNMGATGATPLHYQWWKDDAILTGQTNSVLSLTNAQLNDSGSYSAVVSNGFGSVTSQVATLTVRLPTYSVTTATNGHGSVAVNPLGPIYTQGDVVQIAATPARWHEFSQWNDGVTTNPRSITVLSNSNFTASFVSTTALETLSFDGISRLAPVGMPAVFADDASDSQTNVLPGFTWIGVFVVGTNFSARGSATVLLSTTFPNGTLLYTLDGSDPGISASFYSDPFVLRKSAMLRAIAYNADFTQSVQSDPVEIVILPTLSATTEGGGSVAVDPPAGAYLSDGTALITATPAPGWSFLQWLGDAAGTNPVASVGMSRNKRVQAVFGTALNNTVVGSGSVVINPESEWYPYGTTVSLTPQPFAGNYFALWGNAASGTNTPLSFTVANANPTVTAVFAALPANRHTFTIVADGFGQVSASPFANHYGTGTNVTLTALPDAGQSFLGWSGDASGTQNPLTVVVNSSKFITAQFTKRPQLAPIPGGGVPNKEEFQLLLTGEFGGRYSIEATTNLAPAVPAWEPLATLTNTFGAVQFNDPSPTNRLQRFYRAVEAP